MLARMNGGIVPGRKPGALMVFLADATVSFRTREEVEPSTRSVSAYLAILDVGVSRTSSIFSKETVSITSGGGGEGRAAHLERPPAAAAAWCRRLAAASRAAGAAAPNDTQGVMKAHMVVAEEGGERDDADTNGCLERRSVRTARGKACRQKRPTRRGCPCRKRDDSRGQRWAAVRVSQGESRCAPFDAHEISPRHTCTQQVAPDKLAALDFLEQCN